MTHKILKPRLDAAIRGEILVAYEAAERLVHGSINYCRMGFGAWLLRLMLLLGVGAKTVGAELTEARHRWLGFLEMHRKVGHLSRHGPRGEATEAGAPGAHWAFNLKPVLGVWIAALRADDLGLAMACEADVAREVGFCRAFRLGDGRVTMPCPRLQAIPDDDGETQPLGHDKKQRPWDRERDRFIAVLLGEGKASHEDVSCSRLLELILTLPDGSAIRERLLAAPPPKLLLPIVRYDLPGGFFAEIEATEQSRRVLGADGCNWVLAREHEEIRFGVDWQARPDDLPEFGEPEVIGL